MGDRGRVVDKNPIGQFQYDEDRNGSPNNTPDDHATLLGIADHRIQTLGTRTPVAQLVTEPGPDRRSDSPAEHSPTGRPSNGRDAYYGKHNN
jgi:hypothetical protein